MKVLYVPVQMSNQPTPDNYLIQNLTQFAPRVAPFFSENSYGKLAMDVTLTPSVQVALPTSITTGQNVTLANQVNAALASIGINRTVGDRMVMFTVGTPTAAYGRGLNWGANSWVWSAINSIGETDAFHELGHSIGLMHSGTIQTGSWAGNVLTLPALTEHNNWGGRAEVNYDASTTMGYEYVAGCHFGSDAKASLGWITPAVFTRGTDQTYDLTPLAAAGGALYAVKIPCQLWDTTSQRVIWLEYRQPIGWDAPYYSSHPGNAGIIMRIGGDWGINVPTMRYRTPNDAPWALPVGCSIVEPGAFQIDVTGPGQVRVRDLAAATLPPPIVIPPPPVAQTINGFSAAPALLPAGGGNVTLLWATSNATSVTLNGTAVGPVGTATNWQGTTQDYTLVAKGSGPDITRTITVTVAAVAPTPNPNIATLAQLQPLVAGLTPTTVTQPKKDQIAVLNAQLVVGSGP